MIYRTKCSIYIYIYSYIIYEYNKVYTIPKVSKVLKSRVRAVSGKVQGPASVVREG